MDYRPLLTSLRQERDRINTAIMSIERLSGMTTTAITSTTKPAVATKANASTAKSAMKPGPKAGTTMSAETRKKISEALKARHSAAVAADRK